MFRRDPIFLIIGNTIKIDASIAPIFSTGKLGLSHFRHFMSAYSVAINTIRACWIIFMAVWLLAAISTKRSVYRESPAQRLRYSILLIAGYFLLIRGHRLPYSLSARVLPHIEVMAWAGAALCAAGLAFCIWARITLGRNWSGAVTLKEEHELIERGPYRLVRHPIYTGLIAMFLATAIVLGHVGGIIGLVLVFVSFWIKLSDEERVMLKQFPDQYAAYQHRVKRIIPFVL
jgi:protein-S-isoprenylcysteine O-methyltransferase Ste14